ncbi:carbohydrate ABC transporter permease [Fodinicola acaciae]|uniref:carbohydrate ABC transporter permease n=1 Tax=Fodinicola acaciae TaxID=2681555 RepID=UPI001C9E9207|nr:carbohydrate ABC transporter permease [Fodinicola acaciae]
MRHRWTATTIGIVLIAVMLFPVYWMINASLQPAGTTLQGSWIPFPLDVSGYATAIADQGRNLLTSLVVATGSVVVCLLVAAPAAYGLAQFRIRGSNAVVFGILITQMIPGIVIANALYSVYNDLGLLNSVPGLILADATLGIPFSILIIRAFMQGIPREIVEAGRVDGAGHFRVFRSVIVPVSANALITAGLFTFLFAWSDFLFALTLTTNETVRPITLGIYQYIGAHTNQWNAIMATTVLASIPAAVLLVVAQRYVAAGATGGAVK